MKKLFALVVVLSLATTASAAVPGTIELWIVSLNGQTIPAVKEITISPSDVINMDIVYDGRPDYYLFGLGYRITASGGLGALDMTQMTYDPEWDPQWEIMDEIVAGREYEHQVSALDMGIEAVSPPIWVLDHILFHCEGLTGYGQIYDDVYIDVEDLDPGNPTYTNEWNPLVVPADIQPLVFGPGVIVHQIPEPVTLTLLGLGGLALIRRRR
jgi:hypothetical protein